MFMIQIGSMNMIYFGGLISSFLETLYIYIYIFIDLRYKNNFFDTIDSTKIFRKNVAN